MDLSNLFSQFMAILKIFLQNIESYVSGLDFTKVADILLYNPREPLLFSSGAFLFIFLVFMIGYYCLRNKLMQTSLCDALLLLFLLIRVVASISYYY